MPIFDSYGVSGPHNPQNVAYFCILERVGAEM